MASNKIERAHQMYRDDRYGEALRFYMEAIAMTKTNSQKIALHSNRAAYYLKLHDFKKLRTTRVEVEVSTSNIKYLAIRERVKEKKLVIEHVNTELMITNPLTKGMPPKNFKDHVVRMRFGL